MSFILYKKRRFDSRGPDYLGSIRIVLEEKRDEVDALRSMSQLRRYGETYPMNIIVIELSEIGSIKKLKDLINKLKITLHGRLILLKRESYYIAHIIYADIGGTVMYIYK